jgi:hypothetical protein
MVVGFRDRRVEQFHLYAGMHLPPHAQVGVELHPQVDGFDPWPLGRGGLDDSQADDVGVATTTPQIRHEVVERILIAD